MQELPSHLQRHVNRSYDCVTDLYKGFRFTFCHSCNASQLFGFALLQNEPKTFCQ